MKRILILGGGSAGTMLANMLARRGVETTLISESAEHLFQPALLYVALAGAKTNIVRDERRLLSRRVNFARERISRVDLAGQSVVAASGARFDYDELVVATGARADCGQIPGLGEIAERYGNYHSGIARARKLWEALDSFRGGTIAVGQASPICVCPPSPVEGVLLIDRLLRRRRLRDKSRLIYFTPFPRAYPARPMNDIVEPILKSRGIEIRVFFDVDRVDAASRAIFSIEGERIECDLPVIIPPVSGADIAYEPAAVLNPERFLIVDRATLRLKGAGGAFAIGDAADLPTSKAGAGAHLQAKAVFRQLMGEPAAFDGRTHCAFDFGDGTGTFVVSSYASPAVRYPPTRIKHFMKMLMGWFYWLSLSAFFEPLFDWYFAWTAPEKLSGRWPNPRKEIKADAQP